VTRTGWTDWYVVGDESAVFVDGHVLVLSALATLLVTRAAQPTSLDDLAAALVAAFGEPDGADPLAATEQVVTELVGRGVLAVAAP